MADNTTLNTGSGGDVIASDDIAGVKHQRTKLSLGADGSATDALGGAGAVAAGVQRVTLASDDPAVTALEVIDNLVLAEDAVHGSGDPGVQALGVRNDTLAALAGTDGDYAPFQFSASGALYVTAADSGGSPVTPIKEDDAAGGTDVGVPMLVVRDDEQAAMTPADGDYTTLRSDKFGNLKVTQLPDATSEVKFAAINTSTSGDNTLVAAAGAGIKIRVLSAFMVAAGTVTTRFESGASGTALTGQMPLVVNSGYTLPYNPAGWFETADNTLLNLELSAAVAVHGCLSYVEV